ncbi:MAG: hypothetical protein ACK4ZD_10930 [Caldimonas sp.]|jgi:hypothetical protein|uniref:hypothetical protein n=1 Tax=Caldimonas sp. TaxID=2838790 RepID=UPI00391C2B22
MNTLGWRDLRFALAWTMLWGIGAAARGTRPGRPGARNLQRHSDHHMHAGKPYASLEPLPGPQLPTGYAGCIWLAMVPPLWFRLMHPRLARWQPAPA